MEEKTGVRLIGEVQFRDVKVKVYHDPLSKEKNVMCSWGARNPDGFYRGLVHIDNNGKLLYPDGAVIPEQTDRDRELLPKFLITGQKEMDEELIASIGSYLEKDCEKRNQKTK